MNVLSLFDGISSGQVALQRANIKVDKYFASEIDKYCIKVTQHHFPNTIQLGDVTKINVNDLPQIDMLIGGSPCQGFSYAGKMLNFNDPRSALFFEYVRILKELKEKNPNLIFLLENVRMKQEWQDVISELLEVKPIEINSALVSAQNRRRLYWTNIQGIEQPKDKSILLRDILQSGEAVEIYNQGKSIGKSITLLARDYKGFGNQKMTGVIQLNDSKESGGKQPYMQNRIYDENGKSPTLTSFSNRLNIASIVGRRLNEKGKREDYNKDVPIKQCLQVKSNSDKTACLTTVAKDNVLTNYPHGRYEDVYNKEYEGLMIRRLTPIECERLQTLSDNYTSMISNSQRYKALGNGWTVDVIVHILSYLKA